MKAAHTRQSVLHAYARISDPEQRKGGGLERQTQDEMETFAKRFGFKIGNRVLVDDGVSAWKGLNATPRQQLGQFLANARSGIIPPGDCLLLENYDRLSRQDPWAAIGLVSELRQLGIHIGRLDRMKFSCERVPGQPSWLCSRSTSATFSTARTTSGRDDRRTERPAPLLMQ